MNKAVPWSIKGVDFDAREAAREAARRSGMSLGEWLNSVIADQAAELGVDVEDIDESERLEAVTARLAQMSKRGGAGRTGRRDDVDPIERINARRRPAPMRERPDPRDYEEPRERHAARREVFRDRHSIHDPEIVLDDAIRAFERGARRNGERTAEAISKVARRLEDIEHHLGAARGGDESNPAHEAYARLEARLEALARRKEPDSAESSLQELERKIAAMSERMEGKPKAVEAEASSNDLVRIEAKLNRLLDGVARPHDVARGAPPSRAPQRSSFGDAVAQITRRQRMLDAETGAGNAGAPSQEPAEPAFAPVPDMSALHRDIAALSSRLEQNRVDVVERAAAPSSADLGLLRREIDEMSRGLRNLAPRDAVNSIESAIRDLSQRIDASRQVGVRENILKPIEDLAVDLRRSLADISGGAGIAGLEREIRAVAAKVEAAREPGFDAAALRDIHKQTQDMQSLLQRAISRPVATEVIERQIAALSDRVERLSWRAPTPADNVAVSRGIGEIRDTLDQNFQDGVFQQLTERIESLGRKIDDAVSQSNATDQFDELTQRIDKMQRALAAAHAPAQVVPVDTSALERMMRELALKFERPAPPSSARLEQMVETLAERLTVAGAPQTDMRLVESLQGQIARLGEKIDDAGQSRTDARVLDQLRAEMARVADHLEAGQAQVDPGSNELLHQQMAHLVGRLDQGDASARVLTSLESMVGELFHRIEDIRGSAIDAAEAAAREAMLGVPVAGVPGEVITRELADLRAHQESADRRAHATLSAVHETLEKVVDRLALLEDDLAEVRPEPLASGPAPVFARASHPASEPAPKSPPPFTAARDVEAAKPRMPATAGPDLAADELIEPGSGQASMRRVAADAAKPAELSAQSSFIAAARRAAQAASGEQPGKSAKGAKGGSILDNALASAREKAKAAHMAVAGAGKPAQVDDLESETSLAAPVAAAGKLSKVRSFVAARKRLVYIALFGVIAVVGAVQVMKLLRGPPSRPEIVDLTNPKISQRAAPKGEEDADTRQSSLSTPGVEAPDAAAPGLTQPPLSASGASRFTPGPSANAPAPGGFDSSPVGTIGAKPQVGAKTGVNLREAAVNGSAAAQFELAVRYADGRSVTRDAALAKQWFEKAALQNNAPAQYRLGSHYERGLGVERDAKRAREWYQRAAEAGNIRAMHNLAVLAAEGVEGKPDYAAAASWFRKASEYGVRDSQYNLAILYARGLGIEQNLQQSWALFSLAATQGDEDAAKKRDDVAGRLDAKGLAAAKVIVDTFKVRPSDKAANEVAPPQGGWDMPAEARTVTNPPPVPAPGAKPPAKGKVTAL